MNSAINLSEDGSKPFPSQSPDENATMANTMTGALQRSQLHYAWTPEIINVCCFHRVIKQESKIQTLLATKLAQVELIN